MSWFLSYWKDDLTAKQLGDMHEDETPNAPAYERNMDLWNNAIGREFMPVYKRNKHNRSVDLKFNLNF